MQYIGWGAVWGITWAAVLVSGTVLGATGLAAGSRRRATRQAAGPETGRAPGQQPGGSGGRAGVGELLVRLHTGLLWLPIAASLAGLTLAPPAAAWGPWRLDRLGWCVSLYIALLSLIIQTFSIRYLHGDRAYPRYFTGLTWVTAAAAATWMSGDLAWFACGWAAMGLFLTLLIGL
ncbi:MAG: hypothetical protein K6T30_05040, partial [Alicyclobacillus sp.]|nr:hypothetical protein [Alicyclobacillus sp.]